MDQRIGWIDWMLPDGLAAEARRRARMVAGFGLTMIVMSTLSAVYTARAYHVLHLTPVTNMVMVALGAATLVLLKRRRDYRIAAVVATLAVIGGQLTVAASLGGIRSPQLGLLALGVMIGGFLGGARFGRLCAALALGGVTVFFALDSAGIQLPAPADDNPAMSAFTIHAVGIVSAAIIAALYEASRQRAFAQLGASEANLAALVGNTTDAIWSVDREKASITENAVFVDRFAADRRADAWQAHYQRALAGEHFTVELAETVGGQTVDLEVAFNAIRRDGAVTGAAVFARDISERKRQARRLERVGRELLSASRKAGMAEVATGVLHDIGNALNGVTVSASVVTQHVRDLRVARLPQLAEVLERVERGTLPADDQKRLDQVGVYLRQVAIQLQTGQDHTLEELGHLARNVERMAGVVAAQQSKARVIAVVEQVTIDEILDSAVQLAAAVLGAEQLPLVHAGDSDVQVRVDRHKVTQILTNLITNAVQAVARAGVADGRVQIATTCADGGLQIEVTDTGDGIAPEHAPRIFTQGFSTRDGGAGIGLHWSVLAAREIGGRLTFSSDGVGHGARFRLELPLTPDG